MVEAVKAEFKKTRATTRAEIKPTKVREFLKKLKLNKYYEHTNAICNILNGVPAPKLPAALEEKLKAMFAEIQQPFERNCPPHRKNFLSYGCVHNGVRAHVGRQIAECHDLARRAGTPSTNFASCWARTSTSSISRC